MLGTSFFTQNLKEVSSTCHVDLKALHVTWQVPSSGHVRNLWDGNELNLVGMNLNCGHCLQSYGILPKAISILSSSPLFRIKFNIFSPLVVEVPAKLWKRMLETQQIQHGTHHLPFQRFLSHHPLVAHEPGSQPWLLSLRTSRFRWPPC